MSEQNAVPHCQSCTLRDHANCTRAKSAVFPIPGGFAIHCCCVRDVSGTRDDDGEDR